jgi:hypothetical protein
VRVRAALLWETGGEPHRDDVVISDEHEAGAEDRVVLVDHDGRRRALAPNEIARGSVLLLPPDVRDTDLERLRRAGYDARRTMFEVIGPDVPMSELVRASAHVYPFVLVTGDGAVRLVAELGGDEATGRWLTDLAAEIGHPVGINFPDEGGSRTIFIRPPSWSEDRLRGWAAGHIGEVEALLGDAEILTPDEVSDDSLPTHWAAAMATSREAAIEVAEAELAEMIERLEHELRREHPDFFDADGQLRTEYVNSKLLERTGGKSLLTRDDVIRLTERSSAPPGTGDAP